jgi:hypothetical protein
METKPKIRLGSGKKRSASWMTSAICLTDAEAHAYEYNGKKYVNLNINVYDTPNQYGKDVAITLNEYEKDAAVPKANAFDTAHVDNLPF